MYKKAIIFLFMLCFFIPANLYPQQRSYQYAIDLGKEALTEGFYRDATIYFTIASLINPDAEEPLFYINLIKRLREGRVDRIVPAVLQTEPILVSHPASPVCPDDLRDEIKELFAAIAVQKSTAVKEQSASRKAIPAGITAVRPSETEKVSRPIPQQEKIKQALDAYKQELVTAIPEDTITQTKISQEAVLFQASLKEEIRPAIKETMVLDDQLWLQQPNMEIELPLESAMFIEGVNLRQFLVVTPGIIEVERVDASTIKISAVQKGSTLLHLWDEKGRWTFTLKVVLPFKVAPPKVKQVLEEADPFIFAYSVNGSSYYEGKRWGSINRRSLTFHQWAGLYGQTPYGKFDGTINFQKFQEKHKVTGYGIGLTRGHLGIFDDFTVRGFDISKRFSSLSLPGRGFRGILFESPAFNDHIYYTLLWGRDRVSQGYLTPGVWGKRKSYIEGMRIVFTPSKENTYSFNYARGYGQARDSSLKDKVFSLELDKRYDNRRLSSEVAYDEDSLAAFFDTSWRNDNVSLSLNLRNIEKNFQTIVGSPGNRGELGARTSLDWKLSPKMLLQSSLDVYRDRFLPSSSKPDRLNYYWSSSISSPLSASSYWRTAMYYNSTPGSISAYRNFRINNSYTKTFRLTNTKNLTLFLGNTYQRSRYPGSGYDRYGVSCGMRFPILANFSYYVDYNQSWVEDVYSGGKSTPRVLTMGVNRSWRFSDMLSGSINVSYRNEEDAQGQYAFLSGEDSVEMGASLSYHPTKDLEFFIDGRARDVWAESSERSAYNELDIRWGMRSSWDLPFTWSPRVVIKGTVFNDINSNKIMDAGEKGIPNVTVKVGRKDVTSDKNGRYQHVLRAKKVIVTIDLASVSDGFIFSTPISREIEVSRNSTEIVDFGISLQAGIYGVVFYDKNHNGKPDADDVFIPKVEMILDNDETTTTDFEGGYAFRNISPGKHSVAINITSLPLEYIPLAKVVEEIEISEGTTYIYHIPLKDKDTGK